MNTRRSFFANLFGAAAIAVAQRLCPAALAKPVVREMPKCEMPNFDGKCSVYAIPVPFSGLFLPVLLDADGRSFPNHSSIKLLFGDNEHGPFDKPHGRYLSASITKP